MTYTRNRGRLAVVIACSAVLTACTLLLNADVEEQCSTDGDCTSRGAAFAGTVCTPQRVCTTPAKLPDSGGAADQNSDAPDLTACTTNAECIDRNGGQAYMCRKSDHRCVSLLSKTCDRIYARPSDLASDDAVYVGFMSAGRTGNTASVGLQEEAAADLAQREITRGAAGLPPASPGLPRRPYIVISCDEVADSIGSVKYLVDELQVPAIIGPALSNNFIAATGTTIAKNVLILSTTASSPLIAGLDKQNLVYSVNPSDALAASAWVKYLPTVEAKLKATGGAAEGQQLKVMVLQRGDGLGIGLVDVLLKKIVFNGKNAVDNGTNFQVVNYGDPFDTVNNPNPAQKYAAAALAIVDFKPHVIIGAGTTEIPEKIMDPAEAAWAEPGYRPFYIGVRALETPKMLELMAKSEDDAGSAKSFRNRIVTTGFGVVGSSIYDNFLLRFKGEFPDPLPFTPGQYAAQGYDATYLMAYAIAAAGPEPLTGARIAAGLLKTQPSQPPGTKIDISPDLVSNALTDFQNGKQLDVTGASGLLDFNNGVVTTDVQLRCPSVDGAGKAVGFKNSGRYLKEATGELAGTLDCPQ